MDLTLNFGGASDVETVGDGGEAVSEDVLFTLGGKVATEVMISSG